MDSNAYSSSSKQGNLFSQSYNISMDSYMGGEFISVPNEGKISNICTHKKYVDKKKSLLYPNHNYFLKYA